MDENVITVTGKGAIHVVPDVTRLELTLQSIHDSYEDAYDQAKANTEKLGKVMSEMKLDSKLPKTIRLDIETDNECNSNNNYTNHNFHGFALDHRVKIDLGMDNVLLNSIVRLIGKLLRQAEIKIGYTVRDTKHLQLKMLENAVKDAKDKAEIMANACGCKLGSVKKINYTKHELKIFSQARIIHDADEARCCNVESLDITPDDLEISDNVTVEWYICNNTKKDE